MKITASTIAVAVVALLMATTAHAQGPKGGSGAGSGHGMGPGMTMGPGMMGMGGFSFACNPRAAGMAEWRIAAIETAVKPTEAQKAKLSELRAASAKAAQTINDACSGDPPTKSVERMAVMEKRLEAMLQAAKVVRPAFQGFYESLDDAQKAKLDAAGPRQWGWQQWRWRWSQ